MKVVIFGVTGFIARPIAQAFVRAGHIVYGTARSESSSKSLLQEEILPLVCDAGTEEGRKVWGPIVAQADIVIDALPFYSPDIPLSIFQHVVSLNKERPQGAKVSYIYTGGSWVHSRGPGGLDTWTDERQPHSGQNKLTSWRWDVEKEVLESDDVNGIVIRPSMLYGKGGSLFSSVFFQPAVEAAKKGESFDAVSLPETRYSTIHADDLADLYLRVAERAPICKGQAFVGTNPQSEKLTDILDAVVRVSGAKGWKQRKPDPENPFDLALVSTTNMKPSLGYALTGWTPRKMSLVDGIDVYWQSFLASQ